MKTLKLFIFFISGFFYSQISLNNLLELTVSSNDELTYTMNKIYGFEEIFIDDKEFMGRLFKNKKQDGDSIEIIFMRLGDNKTDIILRWGENINLNNLKSDIVSANFNYLGIVNQRHLYSNNVFLIAINDKPDGTFNTITIFNDFAKKLK